MTVKVTPVPSLDGSPGVFLPGRLDGGERVPPHDGAPTRLPRGQRHPGGVCRWAQRGPHLQPGEDRSRAGEVMGVRRSVWWWDVCRWFWLWVITSGVGCGISQSLTNWKSSCNEKEHCPKMSEMFWSSKIVPSNSYDTRYRCKLSFIFLFSHSSYLSHFEFQIPVSNTNLHY